MCDTSYCPGTTTESGGEGILCNKRILECMHCSHDVQNPQGSHELPQTSHRKRPCCGAGGIVYIVLLNCPAKAGCQHGCLSTTNHATRCHWPHHRMDQYLYKLQRSCTGHSQTGSIEFMLAQRWCGFHLCHRPVSSAAALPTPQEVAAGGDKPHSHAGAWS